MRWFESIRSLFELLRVPVRGPRSHVARYTESRLCAVRWMSGAFAPLAILSAFGMSMIDADTMEPVFHADLMFSAWVPHLVIALPALAFIAFVHRQLTVRQACWWAGLIGLTTLVGVGMLQGLSHMSATLIGYSLAYFLVAVALPLTPLVTAAILSAGFASAITAAGVTGTGDDWLLIPSIVFAGMGLAAQQYGRISFMRYERAQLLLKRKTRTLQAQTQQLERRTRQIHQLLSRTLTAPVARELQSGRRFPPQVDEVVVLYCDIVGFSRICSEIPAKQLVEALQRFFNRLDECCQAWAVEPIGSAGDSRLAVAGRWLSERGNNDALQERAPAVDALMAALRFQETLIAGESPADNSLSRWQARIGVHVGPVMMGVMDGVRLSFDVWGDTVNMAARLQQAAEPGTVLASRRVLACARGLFDHGEICTVKEKHETIEGAPVRALHPDYRDEAGQPNAAFWQRYRDPDFLLMDPAASGPGVTGAPPSSPTTPLDPRLRSPRVHPSRKQH